MTGLSSDRGRALYTQLIRTIGISLSIALVVTFLLTRRFREAGLTMGVFIAGAFLQTWITLSNGRALISAVISLKYSTV